ncbi:hypothetical protein A2899_00205 [Candidatus Amesbacteria bacterium RIFCSPLOWO2_01_FULL_49_25]|uniref:Uncharacterized protein n=1 Tax=Candidatus Amesbacteria bacterium RIFCSPHIGHO2_01_FULL_48_32b TaxID=1797253 RepID=A0A1F4YH21_9BACT|nr:MAG: hypothetical protein A2876_04950 [Candidatus Amesbacteria bacterium RIFCSPHIGHO2_01_FULL_48_32b]OGD07044.1 MAG: hypothetical protein A2899_00205 [Candidatus Amesbacteria bacterium RIFCSPLOWO2_01_FULL_49_25]
MAITNTTVIELDPRDTSYDLAGRAVEWLVVMRALKQVSPKEVERIGKELADIQAEAIRTRKLGGERIRL